MRKSSSYVIRIISHLEGSFAYLLRSGELEVMTDWTRTRQSIEAQVVSPALHYNARGI
jgi:hypothetical protein